MSAILFGLLRQGAGATLSEHFSWFHLVPGFDHQSAIGHSLGLATPSDAAYLLAAWTMVAIVLGFALLARMGLQAALAKEGNERYLPDSGLSLRNIGEVLTEGLYNMVHGVLGEKETQNFFPLIAAFFTYVLFSNLMGFIPGFGPVTGNFSSNFALGMTSFLAFNYAGLSRDPVGYVKHLAGPVALLAPVFLVLESVSLCIRPISLTFRLTVNIFVDHLLQSIAQQIGDGILGFIGMVAFPIPFYFLGLLVCFIQAFIFSLLSTVYVSMSLPHAEHHDEHHNAHH